MVPDGLLAVHLPAPESTRAVEKKHHDRKVQREKSATLRNLLSLCRNIPTDQAAQHAYCDSSLFDKVYQALRSWQAIVLHYEGIILGLGQVAGRVIFALKSASSETPT